VTDPLLRFSSHLCILAAETLYRDGYARVGACISIGAEPDPVYHYRPLSSHQSLDEKVEQVEVGPIENAGLRNSST
jgi:hypothetical protein